jgi:hypothetical protein
MMVGLVDHLILKRLCVLCDIFLACSDIHLDQDQFRSSQTRYNTKTNAFTMRTTLFYRMGRTGTALRPTTTRSLCPETRLFSTNTTLKDSYEYIQVEQKKESGVGLIRLHRPKAMNALSDALFQDLIHAATALDQDDSVGCLVLTGSTKAFAAGADIAEMKDRTFDYTYKKVGSLLRGQLVAV